MAKKKKATSRGRSRIEKMPVTYSPGNDYTKPTTVANELGVAPQEVYGLASRRRVRTGKDSTTGQVLVHKLDVEQYFHDKKAGLHRGGGSTKITLTGDVIRTDPPFKPGTIITYHPKLVGRKPVIAVVVSTNRLYTVVDSNTIVTPRGLQAPTRRMKREEWQNQTLHKLVARKEVAVLNPWEVLAMMAQQFELHGQHERAASLKDWIKVEAAKRKEEQANANNQQGTLGVSGQVVRNSEKVAD
jgi:hypothetical protein